LKSIRKAKLTTHSKDRKKLVKLVDSILRVKYKLSTSEINEIVHSDLFWGDDVEDKVYAAKVLSSLAKTFD
jgi:hypothetical protein